MRQPCVSYGRLSVRKKMVFADADTDSPIYRRVKRVRVEVNIYIYKYKKIITTLSLSWIRLGKLDCQCQRQRFLMCVALQTQGRTPCLLLDDAVVIFLARLHGVRVGRSVAEGQGTDAHQSLGQVPFLHQLLAFLAGKHRVLTVYPA